MRRQRPEAETKTAILARKHCVSEATIYDVTARVAGMEASKASLTARGHQLRPENQLRRSPIATNTRPSAKYAEPPIAIG